MTYSDAEQNKLDSTMEREIVSHQSAVQAALEKSQCLKCHYVLRNVITDRMIKFVCGDPACGWSVMYPIVIIGNSNRCGPEWAAGYAEGFGEGEAKGFQEGMHAQTKTVNGILNAFHPLRSETLCDSHLFKVASTGALSRSICTKCGIIKDA